MSPNDAAIDPVRVFRALGHGTRLRIAEALAQGDCCVNDLRELVGSSWSTVSEHLSVLRDAGIVSSTRRGNQAIYSLRLPCVTAFTNCLLAAAKDQQSEVRACCN